MRKRSRTATAATTATIAPMRMYPSDPGSPRNPVVWLVLSLEEVLLKVTGWLVGPPITFTVPDDGLDVYPLTDPTVKL